MNNLEIYELYGFKFFLCKADKTPDITDGKMVNGKWIGDSWQDEKHHLTVEQAETYQKTGRMIGAWIPENVIVVDLDRHEGKPNGVKTMEEIKKQYKIEYSITDNTLMVLTSGNGFHVFYTTDKTFRQNQKAPGVDLKTNKGYVIAAGSPGYKIINEFEPMALPFELEQWLLDCETTHESKKETTPKTTPDNPDSKKKLPIKVLKSILNKVDVKNFSSNDRWLEFIMSCIAVSGNTPEIHTALDEWSKKDPAYSNEKSVVKRIESFDEIREITTGTFIHFLREENISQYIINQIVKLDSISSILIDAENSEINLPFCDPDYNKLSETPSAQEFFHIQGNTAAAAILEKALENIVLYNNGEKESNYFDGNRWIKFNDYFGIVYTIIYRVIKIIYGNTIGDKESNDRMYKCVSALNTTQWKQNTWREFCYKELIFKDTVKWDSPKITETITTIDNVIDFKEGKIEIRKGNYSEYRKSYFEYSTDEIINAKEPGIFIKFFDSLFPDKETLETAKYCISMSISGNAGKRLFQLWQGVGRNGKTTLLETMKHVLGEEKSYKFPSEILITGTKKENYKAETAKFQGKYFCYSTEVEKGARLSQNLIKALTGGDTMAGRSLYKDPVEFEATWQIIYAVNDMPFIYGDDYAFVDRLMVIPFKMFFWLDESKKQSAIMRGVQDKYLVKADDTKKFKESLYSEKAGIIKWMIDNYNYLNNELKGSIPESAECNLKKSNYVDDNDDMGVFIKEVCQIDETGEKGWFIILEDIAEAFRDFTGSHKRATKGIIKDLLSAHDIISRGTTRKQIFDSYGNGKKISARTLKNILLKDETEQFEAKMNKEKRTKETEKEKLLIDEIKDDKNLTDTIPF